MNINGKESDSVYYPILFGFQKPDSNIKKKLQVVACRKYCTKNGMAHLKWERNCRNGDIHSEAWSNGMECQ